MSNKSKSAIIVLLCINMFCGVCSGGSIWAKNHKLSKGIYSDDKAHQIGDIITVIINESTNIKNDIKRDLENKTSRSIGFDADEYLDRRPFSWLPRIPGVTDDIEATSSKDQKSSEKFEDKRTMTDKITVHVEDIHPNGNLVIVGSRHRDVADDRQTILISGIIRPRDILFDNTIRSDQIADFRMIVKHDGVSEDYTKPGWLASIFDSLWPF